LVSPNNSEAPEDSHNNSEAPEDSHNNSEAHLVHINLLDLCLLSNHEEIKEKASNNEETPVFKKVRYDIEEEKESNELDS
jgi:hypothetical protein